MEPTNLAEEGGLIRIVESKEDKIARLEKKAKTYDKIIDKTPLATFPVGMASTFGGLALFGGLLGMVCGFAGALAITMPPVYYFIYKKDKVRKQLRDLYDKK
jgi:hypothetical protein